MEKEKSYSSRIRAIEIEAGDYLKERIISSGGEFLIDESKLPVMDGEIDHSMFSLSRDGEYRVVKSVSLAGMGILSRITITFTDGSTSTIFEEREIIKIADSVERFYPVDEKVLQYTDGQRRAKAICPTTKQGVIELLTFMQSKPYIKLHNGSIAEIAEEAMQKGYVCFRLYNRLDCSFDLNQYFVFKEPDSLTGCKIHEFESTYTRIN